MDTCQVLARYVLQAHEELVVVCSIFGMLRVSTATTQVTVLRLAPSPIFVLALAKNIPPAPSMAQAHWLGEVAEALTTATC